MQGRGAHNGAKIRWPPTSPSVPGARSGDQYTLLTWKSRIMKSSVHAGFEQDDHAQVAVDQECLHARYPMPMRGSVLVFASSSPVWFSVFHFSEIIVRSQGFILIIACRLEPEKEGTQTSRSKSLLRRFSCSPYPTPCFHRSGLPFLPISPPTTRHPRESHNAWRMFPFLPPEERATRSPSLAQLQKT